MKAEPSGFSDTEVMLEFSNNDTYSSAACFASVSNQRKGVIVCMMLPIVDQRPFSVEAGPNARLRRRLLDFAGASTRCGRIDRLTCRLTCRSTRHDLGNVDADEVLNDLGRGRELS